MLTSHKIKAGLVALTAAVPIAIAATALVPANAASTTLLPNTLKMTVTNNSGRSPVYLYVLGQSLTSSHLGYADRNGGFHEWGPAGVPPVPAPDVSIPMTGTSMDIQIPKLSGRIYFSFGEKLKFQIVSTPIGTGLVQPAPWAAGDANRNIMFDWSEYTYNDGGIWLNSSQVDMFAAPHTVEVTGSSGTHHTGQLSTSRNEVFQVLHDQPGGWANLVYSRPSDGLKLRALAPGKGIDAGLLSKTILDPYINASWDAYRNKDLTVIPFGDQPNTKFFGRVSGNAFNFRNSSGAQVASFQKPSTANVFGCDGAIQAPNDLVVGPIARTLCAALNRGVLAEHSTQPYNVASAFYHPTATDAAITNQYARKIHARMVDGKAYAFPFDDVGNYESLVHDNVPSSAKITLGAL